MKLKLILFASLVIGAFFWNHRPIQKTKEFKKIPKAQRVEAMAEQEFNMIKDLATNTVPRHEIYEANLAVRNNPSRTVNSLKWEERGPDNYGGRTRTMALDLTDPTGNTIWSGGVAGGLWKCTNAFSNNYQWEQVHSYTGNSAISSIVVDPIDPKIIYVGTGEGWFNLDAYPGDGIYRSINAGQTWNKLEATSSFRYIQKLLISKDRLFACTRGGGVQMSLDRGETWVKSLGNGQFGFSERAGDIDLASNGDLYACMGFNATNDGVYKSKDNGNTWEYLQLPGGAFRRTELAVAQSNPDVVYVLKENNSSRAVEEIAKSVDGGSSWEILEAPDAFGMDYFTRGQAWYDLSIAVDPTNENKVYIGGVDLLTSSNGGLSWNQVSQWYGGFGLQYVHADQHFAQYLDNTGNKIAFTNDGGLYLCSNAKSNNPNIEWKNQDYNTIQFYACAVHPNDQDWILGGTQDNGTYLIDDPGMNSATRVTGGDGAYCHIDRDNPNIQISSYVYNSYYVTNNSWAGNTQNYRYSPDNESIGFFINPTDYDDVHNRLVCSAGEGAINILNVLTGSFDFRPFSQLGDAQVTAIKVHPNLNSRIYLGTDNGKIFQMDSLMQGDPKLTQLFDASGSVRNIDVDLSNDDRLLFTISNIGSKNIYLSEDGGQNWQDQDGDLPNIPVRWGLFNTADPSTILLATELGVWSADNLDADNTVWVYNNMGISPTRVDMLDIRASDHLLVAATHGRGMFTANLCSGNVDNDNDGFTCENDCDDFNANINSAQAEIPYNGIDDDCDPLTLDNDLDQDGFDLANDCDDNNAMINPDAQEIENNDIDENCDGEDVILDCDSFASGPWDIFINGSDCLSGSINSQWNVWSNEAFYVKDLKDGYGYYFDFCQGYDSNVFEAKVSVYYYNIQDESRGSLIESKDSCRIEFEYLMNGDYPDLLIILHDVNNCQSESLTAGNGTASFGCLSTGIDEDGDGYTTDVDCDDNNVEINPGIEEIPYNGIDDDCNLSTPDDDLDGDGYLMAEDCDDLNSDINPGEDENLFNGIDDDCDPNTLDNDFDGDGYGIDVDCDETNPDINPGATEIPGNGIDENCDGLDVTVSVNELSEAEIKLYPNPFNDFVLIETKSIEQIEIKIMASNGQLVGSQNFSSFSKEIDLSKLSSGLYFVKVTDLNSGKNRVLKIIKR